jgi:hypothetical protein
MTKNRIAVVSFQDGSDHGYEYLLGPNFPEKITHAVVPNRGGASMKVVKVQAVKDLLDKDFTGELIPVIAAFNLDDYEAYKRRLKRKANVEKAILEKLENLGLVAKIKALGLDNDPEISALVDEYKSL